MALQEPLRARLRAPNQPQELGATLGSQALIGALRASQRAVYRGYTMRVPGGPQRLYFGGSSRLLEALSWGRFGTSQTGRVLTCACSS